MNNTTTKKTSKTYLGVYFLLTFALSWILWIPLAASGKEVPLAILVIGAFTPSLMGVLLTYWSEDKTGRKEFWRRVVDFKRIKPVWYVVILLMFPLVLTLTYLIQAILGGPPPTLQGALETLTNLPAMVMFIITMLVGGPLAEELGWRGFALDRLQRNFNALNASLVLGCVHVAWHIPLFFIPNTVQGAMGFATVRFWIFTAQVVLVTVIYTWVYNHNQRSTLSAILIHFMSNSTTTFIAQMGNTLPLQTEIIRTAIFFVVISVIIGVWGPKTLVDRRETALN